MSEYHSVLRRQLRRIGIDDPSEIPDSAAWSDFLERVSQSYENSDEDRYRLERSLDISSMEMEELHAQLSAEHDKLHAVLAALSDGICYMNRDWEVQFLNPSGEQMLDVARDEATGRSLFEFIDLQIGPGDLLDGPNKELEETLREATPYAYDDCDVINHSGIEFPADATFNPMVRDGELEGIVLKITDITSQKKAQSKIEEARDEAQEARRAREAQAAFLANMSHELRTPLNAIIGYSELVTEDADAFGYSEVIPDLEKIRMAGKHLVTLISDVLDMSKIEAGKVELEIESFRTENLIDDVVVMLEPEIAASGNEFIVDIDDSLGEMRSDRTKLRQILSNLLNNAGKFTDNGTVRIAASREERANKTWYRFEVEDTGIGLAEEKLPRLFEAFTQEDESTTRKYGGTGLGLAICKNYCEMLGGSIEVKSELGEGTTFTIAIPSLVASRPAMTSEKLKIPLDNASGDDADVTNSDADDAEIALLVIDDEPSVHDMITRYLSHRPVRVHSALSGRKGIELARQLQPDAIVADILMSNMSGWEVLSELKSNPETADIPVVIGSILNEESKAYNLGADDYLVKPIDRESLNSILDRYATSSIPRALVVEDDEDLRYLLKRKLERQDWAVSTAAHGGRAHQFLQEYTAPDLILLDLMMPEVDGFDLLQILNSHPRWREIPVVVLTAMDLSNHEKKLLKTHVQQILFKGAQDEAEILTEIMDLISHLSPVQSPQRIGTS